MHVDLSPAWRNAHRILDQFVALIPNLILAVSVLVAFIVAGAAVKRLIKRFAWKDKRHTNLPLLFGRLAQAVIVVLGMLISFSIVAPSFAAADIVKMLGVGGVAIGFAFHDILQNFLAGVLLLVHEPFQVGDQIAMDAFSGTVEDIQSRVTLLRNSDGRQIVIPNSDLFTHTVVVGLPSEEHRNLTKTPGAPAESAALVSK